MAVGSQDHGRGFSQVGPRLGQGRFPTVGRLAAVGWPANEFPSHVIADNQGTLGILRGGHCGETLRR